MNLTLEQNQRIQNLQLEREQLRRRQQEIAKLNVSSLWFFHLHTLIFINLNFFLFSYSAVVVAMLCFSSFDVGVSCPKPMIFPLYREHLWFSRDHRHIRLVRTHSCQEWLITRDKKVATADCRCRSHTRPTSSTIAWTGSAPMWRNQWTRWLSAKLWTHLTISWWEYTELFLAV